MSTTASISYAAARPASMTRAGKAFIAVFLIVVLEGAVRKWVASSATLPLLLARDLLAIYVIAYALRNGALRRQKAITQVLLAWSCLVIAWGLLQLVVGESSPPVLLIGLRFWLLYIWFGVAAAATMNEADYRAAMRVAAWSLLLMTPLVVLQHFSPPGARINSQIDGDESDVFLVIADVVRTTGTFSFTAGYATYLALMAPLVLAAAGARKRPGRQTLFAAALFAAFVVSSMVSGSRATVILSGLMVVGYFLARLWLAPGKGRAGAIVGVIAGMLLLAVLLYVFRGAIAITEQRFQEASEVETFWGRIFTIFIGQSAAFDDFTWIGYGIGLGSNLASYVRTGSTGVFALAEVESSRILLEGGLIGYVFTAIKVGVIVVGVRKAWRLSKRLHSAYPILLWALVSLALLTWSAIGQLTAHALFGLMLAFGLLVFRHPTVEFFPPRHSST
ncbi:hypothetical protein [Variovorax ginsengisoli]|uniref:O-antigen ligase domain-containing protein n=1 Tax=Variovorax ginsengisoli TaxID=363844 RepID=A0ABT8S086_9BURK|nr:hypothetical protein [Variovorax ginsengisoli]MDN8612449.1 hypothetical protein [Variovorax ginsengisoli]MDO1531619.1 hypothetical protein [Variovorax ginsengisoli]